MMRRRAQSIKGYPSKNEQRRVNLRREHLALDLLAYLRGDELRPSERPRRPFHIWRPLKVSFEGEDGIDDDGLTVNVFAQAFRSLRSHANTRGLFEVAARNPDGEEWVLPRSDRGAESVTPIHPGMPDGASFVGGSDGLSSVEAMRLVGLLLTKALILGDGFFVDDRFPDYILEYLSTENVESLNEPEGALAALEQCRSVAAAECARRWLETPCKEMMAAIMIDESECSRFLLFDCHLPQCPLFKGWGAEAESTGAPIFSSCDCHNSKQFPLTDANKGGLIMEAVRLDLYERRSKHLQALKSGFLGEHHADEIDRICHDFSAHLNLFSPPELAVRLRGVPVSGAEALWQALEVRQQKEGEESYGKEMHAVDTKAFEAASSLLERFVRGGERADGGEVYAPLDAQGVRTLLRFITGQTSLSGSAEHRAANPVVVHIYHDPNGFLPTAAACQRTLLLPASAKKGKKVYASEEEFRGRLWRTLHEFAERDKASYGGAGFEYA